MKYNELEINGNLFSDLSNLQELYLNDNKLKRIDSVTFKGLTKLEIEEIDGKLFSDLSSLKEIYLYNNPLKRIDSVTLKGLRKLNTALENTRRLFSTYNNHKLVKIIANLESLSINLDD